MSDPSNNVELKDREGKAFSESGPAYIAKIIFIVGLLFALVGIVTNSFYPISGMKKGGIFLGFTLCLVFLLYPTKIKGKQLAWLDLGLAALGAFAGFYTFFTTDRFSFSNLQMTQMDMVMSVITVLLVIEATRRAVGNILALLPVLFSLYALFGKYIPGIFGHNGFTFQRYMMRLYMVDEGLYGMTMQVAASYVFLFILFGSLLSASGVATFFTDCANRIAGARPGGPAKVAVISSGLMGTISGSAVANVATTGAFTIPLMKKVGFSPTFAGAVEAVASTGGMIMPPIMGSAAFLMIQYLGVPYQTIMLAALIPAFLYYLSCYVWVHFEALRIGNRGMDKADIKRVEDLKRRIFLLTPLVGIVVAMVIGYTPIFAAFIGMILTILAGLIQKDRLTFKAVINALVGGAKTSITAMMACIAAGIIVGVCNMTGVGQVLTYNIVNIAGGSLFFALLLTAVACIFLSMGLPAAACYILVATIVAPALVRMGVTDLAAHMFVFYFSCYSNITPPVAIASYTAAGISGAKPFQVAWFGIKIAAPGFIIPFLFSYNPILLLQNVTAAPLIISIVTATLGVVFIAVAGVGYSMHRITLPTRILYGVASLLLIVPETTTDIIGTVLIILAFLWDLRTHRQELKLSTS